MAKKGEENMLKQSLAGENVIKVIEEAENILYQNVEDSLVPENITHMEVKLMVNKILPNSNNIDSSKDNNTIVQHSYLEMYLGNYFSGGKFNNLKFLKETNQIFQEFEGQICNL